MARCKIITNGDEIFKIIFAIDLKISKFFEMSSAVSDVKHENQELWTSATILTNKTDKQTKSKRNESVFSSGINQLDALNFGFTISLFHASTCFEHMCSKHVEAWNKLIVKQIFCVSSWLITEINIVRCTVSKTCGGKKKNESSFYNSSACVTIKWSVHVVNSALLVYKIVA